MREFFQRLFIRFLVKDVFHTFQKEDILIIRKDGVWEWKGRELGPEMVELLKTEAQAFRQSTLWKVLKSELLWQLIKTLMERGRTETDIRVAQIGGYLTQVIDEKLKSIEPERGR